MKKILSILPITFVIILVSISISSSAEIPTIIVDETELVNLEVSAIDEDGDPVYFSFGEPLNEFGQWQTTYGDNGTYNIEVKVSDGTSITTQEILIIVNKANWPPVIEPIEDFSINEGDKLILEPEVRDEENDEVTITISDPIGDDGEWQTGYEDVGEYDIIVTASDYEHTVSQEFTLTVVDVNRAPELISYYLEEDFSINEGEQIDLSISALDPDGDSIKYLWNVDGKEVSELNEYRYKPNFDSAGFHEIKASASDGYKKTTAIWNVEVLNVNRAPEFRVIDEITMSESDLLKLEFEALDPDGDEVTYTISEPIGNDGEWQTGYEDAGVYFVEISVTDGDLTPTKTITLIVNEVDRAPYFEKVDDFTVNEGETVTIELKARDEDGQEVVFSLENAPSGAYIDGNNFVYDAPYDTILRPNDLLQKTLKGVHLDEFYYKNQKDFIVTFSAAGNGASTKQDVKITVNNVNLPPLFEELDNIMVNEGEIIKVVPTASDPDNDDISFTFSEPLDKKGKWHTWYENDGIYDVTITASDGKTEVSQQISIIVNDVNRAPVFNDMDTYEARENSLLIIKPIVNDPDGDTVELIVEGLPQGAAFMNNQVAWKPDYDFCQGQDNEGIITFIATDEQGNTARQDVKIIVRNVNRKPIIFSPQPESGSIVAFVGRPVTFSAKVLDPDDDELSFTWEFGGFNKILDATPKLRRTFTTSGNKVIKLKVSDGFDTVEKIWRVRVVEARVPTTTPSTTTTTVTTPTTTPTQPTAQPSTPTTSSSNIRVYRIDN
jgi:hypothetical protein